MSPILNILKSDLLDLKLDTECWVTSGPFLVSRTVTYGEYCNQ